MKVGDVVAWMPTRGIYCAQEVKFVGIVTGKRVGSEFGATSPRVPVIWNESTIPTMTDIRDVKVIEATNESR